MPATLVGEIGDGLVQPDPPAAAARHSGESLVDSRPVGEGHELDDEVLLERLPPLFGAFP
jgi:hypothetical protein